MILVNSTLYLLKVSAIVNILLTLKGNNHTHSSPYRITRHTYFERLFFLLTLAKFELLGNIINSPERLHVEIKYHKARNHLLELILRLCLQQPEALRHNRKWPAAA